MVDLFNVFEKMLGEMGAAPATLIIGNVAIGKGDSLKGLWVVPHLQDGLCVSEDEARRKLEKINDPTQKMLFRVDVTRVE